MSMRGINFSAIMRTSNTIYESRPSADRKAARAAWDYFAKRGRITQVRLLDGYWGCINPDLDYVDEVEAIHFRGGGK